MSKTTLNFFGETAIIDIPKDMPSLRSQISEKFLLSPTDAAEIILYYIKDGKKIYIINGNDLSKFKQANASTIFLDINQSSRLYLDNALELDKENQKHEKELNELNLKYNELSKRKEKIEHAFEGELKQINFKIMEINKKKCDIIKKKDIELIKMIKEKEIYESKIYYLQKKMFLPITVPIPKDEVSLKKSPRHLPMLLSFKNNERYAPIKNFEIEKRKEIAKWRAIESAKALALKAAKKEKECLKQNNNLMKKKIEAVKLRAVASAKAKALEVAKKAHEDIINKKTEIEKRVKSAKLKAIAKAEANALKIGKRAAHEEIINKKDEIKKRIEIVKSKTISKAEANALKIGKRAAHEEMINKKDEIKKRIEIVKSKTIPKAKANALKIAKRAHEEMVNNKEAIQKKIEIVKSRAISSAKAKALKVGKLANEANIKSINEQNISINTIPVFKKVKEVLNNTVDKVKEIAKAIVKKNNEYPKISEIEDEKEKLKKEQELKKLKEKEKKEQIDKIVKIARDTVNEINNLTKMVIIQSNNLIEQINDPEKNSIMSSEDIILKASKKEEKKWDAIHFNYSCDGCKMNPIRGNRYKCKGCQDFDFCESCYQKNKESHGHEFTKIEKPKNTRRLGHKNTKYCQRGLVHRDIRCEGCGLYPFVGYRYMCTICDDYNLCENCEERLATRHNHPFMKVTYSGLLDPFNKCYLKMNYYEPEKNNK